MVRVADDDYVNNFYYWTPYGQRYKLPVFLYSFFGNKDLSRSIFWIVFVRMVERRTNMGCEIISKMECYNK